MWYIRLALCIVFLTLWITWRKRKLSLFKRLNIPGPPPSLFFGNFWELVYEGQIACTKRWIEEYGSVFGYYYGLRPVLVVADMDLLKDIQIKEFQKFVNRPTVFALEFSVTPHTKHQLTVQQGKKWKDLRSIISPTFTTLKLKKMNSIFNEAIDELVQAVEKASSNGQTFNIYDLYRNLSVDVFARTSLGIHTNAQKDKNEPVLKLTRSLFSFEVDYFAMLFFSFTELMPIFSVIKNFIASYSNNGKLPRVDLKERVLAAIKVRRSNPELRRSDVLQLMMDAQQAEGPVNDKYLTAGENDDFNPYNDTNQAPLKNGKRLTDEEIAQNSVLLLSAGFETSSTTLAFLTHCLVYNQDVQDKVRAEIKKNVSDDEELSYDLIQKLQYLDMVVNETLRVYPAVPFFANRETTEDIVIGNIYFPKKLAVQVPVYYLHHDPTVWEEPERFNPDRFSPEEKSRRHPMSFQPFGAGPRNCIGMRFAQMEIKMAIAKILRKFRLLPRKGETKEEFGIICKTLNMEPNDGVFIQAERI